MQLRRAISDRLLTIPRPFSLVLSSPPSPVPLLSSVVLLAALRLISERPTPASEFGKMTELRLSPT